MEPVRAGLLGVLLMVGHRGVGPGVNREPSLVCGLLNLELVTLQGEVHLSRSRQNELGGGVGIPPSRCKMTRAPLRWQSVAPIVSSNR